MYSIFGLLLQFVASLSIPILLTDVPWGGEGAFLEVFRRCGHTALSTLSVMGPYWPRSRARREYEGKKPIRAKAAVQGKTHQISCKRPSVRLGEAVL